MESHTEAGQMLGQDPRCALVAALSSLDSIRGVLCFGSYATGSFDDRSDLDLFVLCHPDLVPSEHRRRAFETMEGVTEVRIDDRNAAGLTNGFGRKTRCDWTGCSWKWRGTPWTGSALLWRR